MAHRYTNEEILNLFYIHGECDRVVARTCRLFNERYPELPPMSEKIFRRYQSNFLLHGRVEAPNTTKKRVVDDENNEVDVLTYFDVLPTSSIRKAELEVNLSKSSTQRILRKHKMHDYKFVKVQANDQEDWIRRLNFCETILNHCEGDQNFLKKIIWTDEAKFNNEGVFNRRNLHLWGNENPHAVREQGFQRRFSFNVFALMMDNKLLHFIYDDNLNAQHYLEILRTVVTDFLDDLPLNTAESAWYQMDGAPAHSTNEVREQLNGMFHNRWIGLRGPLLWPPRSPDLTPLDFYLWGTIKNKVYVTPVQTRENLIERVTMAFDSISPDEIRRATNNGFRRRVQKCSELNGHHFEHTL